MGQLLDYAAVLAHEEGKETIYISTGETGLYEKYGYSFWKMMKDVNGEDSRIYKKEVEKRQIYQGPGTRYECKNGSS